MKSKAQQKSERRRARIAEETPRKPGSPSVGFAAMQEQLESLDLPKLPEQERRGRKTWLPGCSPAELPTRYAFVKPRDRFHHPDMREQAQTERREHDANHATMFGRGGVSSEREFSPTQKLVREASQATLQDLRAGQGKKPRRDHAQIRVITYN